MSKRKQNRYGLPDKIVRVLQFLSSLNIKEAFNLIRAIVYLYREYYITVNIEPVIKEYILNLDYKKEKLISCRVENLKDIINILNDVKIAKSFKNDEL